MKPLINKTLIIVSRGNFNPSIFHPSWFSNNSLLSDTEVEKSEIKLITAEISDFAIDWFKIQVTQDRFLVKSTQESHFQSLFDLVLGTFTLLNHTPLKQLGINFEAEFKFENENNWNNYGDLLAPKIIWKKKLSNPGLNHIQMKCERDDNYSGYVLVTIKPSTQIDFGVTFHINDHFELKSVENPEAKVFHEIIQTERNNSIKKSNEIIQSLLED